MKLPIGKGSIFGVRFGSVRSARSRSVPAVRFLQILRLSNPGFGIAVRFQLFGLWGVTKVVALLDLSHAITVG